MLKRSSKVVVTDADTRLEVSIKVSCRPGILTARAAKTVVRDAANLVAQSLGGVHYIDARPDNTRIHV